MIEKEKKAGQLGNAFLTIWEVGRKRTKAGIERGGNPIASQSGEQETYEGIKLGELDVAADEALRGRAQLHGHGAVW
jgi:hypothetical protein